MFPILPRASWSFRKLSRWSAVPRAWRAVIVSMMNDLARKNMADHAATALSPR